MRMRRGSAHGLGAYTWRLLISASTVALLVTLAAASVSAAKPATCSVTNTDTGQTYTRLQQAVDAAKPGHTITVKGTCVGKTHIRKSLVIKGITSPRWGKPILDGARKTRVLQVGWFATVTVRDLTIQHGRASSNPLEGGGIANFGVLTLRNVVVRDNFACNGGGGIYNQGVAILTLAGRTSIRDNGCCSEGCGIYSVRCPWDQLFGCGHPPSITMEDTSSVSGHKHSGVYLEDGTLTMNDRSSIFGNKSTAGGGVDLYGQLVMNDASSIHDNRANEGGGGVAGYGALTLNDASSIHDNRAVAADGTLGQGGGIWFWSWSDDPNPIGVTCGPGGNVYGNLPDDCYFESP